MIPTDIIQKLCDLIRDEDGSVKNKPYEKEWEESNKWLDILEKYMGDDKKFRDIFFNYDMAEGLLYSAMNDYYYRQGFLCGARLALEICGFESTKG